VSTLPSGRSSASVLGAASRLLPDAPAGTLWQGSTTTLPSSARDGRPSASQNHVTDDVKGGPPCDSTHARRLAPVVAAGSGTLRHVAPVETEMKSKNTGRPVPGGVAPPAGSVALPTRTTTMLPLGGGGTTLDDGDGVPAGERLPVGAGVSVADRDGVPVRESVPSGEAVRDCVPVALRERDSDGVPVGERVPLPLTEPVALPVLDDDGVPVVDGVRVPVADDDGVCVDDDDAEPELDGDGVRVPDADAVPVADDEPVPVADREAV
jgi:hypothetical protein